MLTGRFQLAAPGDKLPAEHRGRSWRSGRARGRAPKRAALDEGRGVAAGRRRRRPSSATATRARWARSTCCPPASRAPVAGLEDAEQGPDADDPGAHARGLARADPAPPGRAEVAAPEPGVRRRDRQRLQRRDPARGEAQPVPASARRWRPEEIDALYEATRTTLARAIDVLRERVPPTFEKQVRDFLAVHLRGGEACPRCGTRLSEVSSRSEATTWCRGCQALSSRARAQFGIISTCPTWSVVPIVDAVQLGDRRDGRVEPRRRSRSACRPT